MLRRIACQTIPLAMHATALLIKADAATSHGDFTASAPLFRCWSEGQLPGHAVFHRNPLSAVGAHGMWRRRLREPFRGSVDPRTALPGSAQRDVGGGDFLVDRRSKPSFHLRHRRLTFGLTVQPDAMRGFMDRASSLPRGTGFIARFLIAWPATTQGTRSFRAAPAAMPAVEDYGRRITVLLDTPLPTDTQGDLQQTVLDFSVQAREAWVDVHDRIELGLAAGGDHVTRAALPHPWPLRHSVSKKFLNVH